MNLAIFAALLLLVMANHAVAQTTRSSIKNAGDIRGVSWSDPRDNYNPGPIVPAHLSPTHDAAKIEEIAHAVAGRTLSIGANTVRLGINPPTVADAEWWGKYQLAVRTLTERGLAVILCAWEQSPAVATHGRQQHNGRFGVGDVQSYAEMWKNVHAAFREDANVIGYELINEPFGYRGRVDEYVRDMRALVSAMGPDLRGKKILVAGIGYSDDVQVIKKQFDEPHVWFAYHVYPNWFGGEAGQALFTRERYASEIVKQLAGVESRTVITEFGCWGGPEFDYAKSSLEQATLGARRHVAYLQGVADACVQLKLGSIYWFADARESRSRPRYDLFADDGSVFDQDRLTLVQRAWRARPIKK